MTDRNSLMRDMSGVKSGSLTTGLPTGMSQHNDALDLDVIERPQAANLPAVRWRLINQKKSKSDNPARQAEHRPALESLFSHRCGCRSVRGLIGLCRQIRDMNTLAV